MARLMAGTWLGLWIGKKDQNIVNLPQNLVDSPVRGPFCVGVFDLMYEGSINQALYAMFGVDLLNLLCF